MSGPAPRSPVDLARLAGAELPSRAIETILSALYGQPPTPDQAKRWRSLSKMPWPSRRARRNVVCLGRRSLKTSAIVSWCAAFEALFGRHERHAAPGSRLVFAVVAPVTAQAREATRGICAVLDALAPLGVRYVQRDAAGAPEIAILSPASRCEKVFSVMAADAVTVRSFAVPWVAFDEAGFLPQGAQSGADIVRAIGPAQAQFPGASMLFCSSPGAPQGIFWELTEKPPGSTIVVRAPTWLVNPRITRETCAELAGDEGTFAQEYEASRFGYANSSFIDTAGLVIGSPHAGKGARAGSFVVGLDVAQISDQTAIVVCSGFDVETQQTSAPIRNVVVEHVEVIESSRERPTPIEEIAARVVAISRMFGRAPIAFDPFQGPTVKAALEKLGVREHRKGKSQPAEATIPSRGTYCQRSMSPTAQTPRWRLAKELVEGGRVHMTEDQGVLAQQLGMLRATQQASGSLKVEGKRDDVADAFALAVEIAMRLPPTDGPAGAVRCETSVSFDAGGGSDGRIDVRNTWYRELPLPNGRRVPAEVPRWHASFPAYAEDMIAQGVRTPAIIAWEQEQRETTQNRRAGTVPVRT